MASGIGSDEFPLMSSPGTAYFSDDSLSDEAQFSWNKTAVSLDMPALGSPGVFHKHPRPSKGEEVDRRSPMQQQQRASRGGDRDRDRLNSRIVGDAILPTVPPQVLNLHQKQQRLKSVETHTSVLTRRSNVAASVISELGMHGATTQPTPPWLLRKTRQRGKRNQRRGEAKNAENVQAKN